MEAQLRELRKIFVELLNYSRTEDAEAENIPNVIESMLSQSKLKTLSQIAGSSSFSEQNHELEFVRDEKRLLEQQITELEGHLERLSTENHELRGKVDRFRDEIVNMKGLVRVLCRMKPVDRRVNAQFTETSLTAAGKQFPVDRIFSGTATQSEIFEELKMQVGSVMDGFNICIFAYGQTGSGKTYTMEGVHDNPGLVHHSLFYLSKLASELNAADFSVSAGIKYLEIYNEQLRDLLTGENVQIIDCDDEISLKGCKEVVLSNMYECSDIIRTASRLRVTGATACNERSSRSHLIFILSLTIQSADEKREGSLVLIDLAGSERLSESNAENERLKETQNINKSLSALGNVFTAIKTRSKHVPYRDSKLTHLMKNYLLGKARTIMIVNVDPSNENETVSSLRFASRVSACELGQAGRNTSKSI